MTQHRGLAVELSGGSAAAGRATRLSPGPVDMDVRRAEARNETSLGFEAK